MAVDQMKLITVLKGAVSTVEAHYKGYPSDLFDFVAQIVMLEREHQQRAVQIQKKVSDRIDALSILIGERRAVKP